MKAEYFLDKWQVQVNTTTNRAFDQVDQLILAKVISAPDVSGWGGCERSGPILLGLMWDKKWSQITEHSKFAPGDHYI